VNWYRGLARDSFFDPDACREIARKLAKERTGILYTYCGICIANCPYTKEYINRST
jgi:epoxyqueuosine reductase QueG